MKLTGGAIVARALEDEGIDLTFGIPGTHNIELYDALAESEAVRTVLVTDEQSGLVHGGRRVARHRPRGVREPGSGCGCSGAEPVGISGRPFSSTTWTRKPWCGRW